MLLHILTMYRLTYNQELLINNNFINTKVIVQSCMQCYSVDPGKGKMTKSFAAQPCLVCLLGAIIYKLPSKKSLSK